MLIILNGYPGVGKLTIGRELHDLIGGKFVDNHSIYNLAFALTEFRSREFYETVQAVQDIADARILALPENTPVILTEIITDGSPRTDGIWRRLQKLSTSCGPILIVHLHCDLDENMRRIQNVERDHKRKPRDAEMARRNHEDGKALSSRAPAHLMQLDTTALTASESAKRIADWIARD